jgi:hypothetical protein
MFVWRSLGSGQLTRLLQDAERIGRAERRAAQTGKGASSVSDPEEGETGARPDWSAPVLKPVR